MYNCTTCMYSIEGHPVWLRVLSSFLARHTLQVVSGGDRRGVTAPHTCCAGDTWYVDLAEEEIERTLGVDMQRDVVTCPVPLGGGYGGEGLSKVKEYTIARAVLKECTNVATFMLGKLLFRN